MESGKIIGSQIVIMFIILFIGGVCYKFKLINKQGTKQMSAVALNVVGPALIFMSYQKDYDPDMVKGLLWAFLLSAVSCFVTIIAGTMLVGKKQADKGIERFSAIYSNCAFIGIPLVNGVYGSEGVLYLTAYITMFNILSWTHGYMTMKGERDFSSFVKALRSPAIISIALGLFCYLCQIRVPSIVGGALDYVGSMNTPLAMLIAGATCAQTSLTSALKNPRNYYISVLRLIILPAASFAVCVLLKAPSMILMTITLACACPAAAMGTMLAVEMDKSPQRCSEIFAMTTVLSGITLPIITILTSKLV